jgi:hypothetical protein
MEVKKVPKMKGHRLVSVDLGYQKHKNFGSTPFEQYELEHFQEIQPRRLHLNYLMSSE